MKSIYTKAAAKRIIKVATSIEVVREMRNCVQVTYRANGGRCSTFLSKTAFKEDFINLREEGSQEVTVVEAYHDRYVVKSKDNYYTVRPDYPDARGKCECADAHFRGNRCKHQVAVAGFLIGYKQQVEVKTVKIGAESWTVYTNNELAGTFHFDDWAIGNQYLVVIDGTEFGWFPTVARAEQALINHGKKQLALAA